MYVPQICWAHVYLRQVNKVVKIATKVLQIKCSSKYGVLHYPWYLGGAVLGLRVDFSLAHPAESLWLTYLPAMR